MKEVISTKERVWRTDGRRSGNTTRQIDNAIQLLYEGYIILVEDHWNNGHHKQANDDLFNRILRRIRSEHPHMISKALIEHSKHMIQFND